MNQKQEMLKSLDGGLYDLKSLKKNVDYTRSQAKHLERFQMHRGGGTLFDSIGDFVDMFRMARAAYDDIKINKEADKLESGADSIMDRLKDTKVFVDDAIASEVPQTEKEKNIIEEFVNIKSDDDMYSFVDNHGDTLKQERSNEAFIFDDALDDFQTSVDAIKEYDDALDDFNEESEDYRNQQR